MPLADHLDEARQAKAVVSMQVTDEDALDGTRVNLGFQNLPAGAFATVHQVCITAEGQGHAGYISAEARSPG